MIIQKQKTRRQQKTEESQKMREIEERIGGCWHSAIITRRSRALSSIAGSQAIFRGGGGGGGGGHVKL